MEIVSNENLTSSVQSSLTRGTPAYIVYSNKNIGDCAPVSGSNTHGSVNNRIKSGLSTWNELVNSDTSAVKNAESALKGVDKQVKNKLIAAMQ